MDKIHHGGALSLILFVGYKIVRACAATITPSYESCPFFFLFQSFCPVAFFPLLIFSPDVCCVLLAAVAGHQQKQRTYSIYMFLYATPWGSTHTEFLITRFEPIKVNMFSKSLKLLLLLGTYTHLQSWVVAIHRVKME